MFNFSKPMTMIGAGAMILYIIVCVTAGITFFTFLLTYSYASSSAVQSDIPLRTLSALGDFMTQTAVGGTMQSKMTEQANTVKITAVPTAFENPTATITIVTEMTSTQEVTPSDANVTQAVSVVDVEITPTTQPEDVARKEMETIVQRLNSEGVLNSTQGTYHAISDYEDSWNQIDWYRWTYIEYPAANFVIRAKASWDTTSRGGTSQNSGCGFIFRENGTENHYLMYLGLNGRVYFFRVHDGKKEYIGNSVYYPVEIPTGQAEIMLVANGNRFYFYVNGDYLYDPMDGYFQEGKLGLTVLTGNAQDFGTRCKMEDIGLWVIE